MAVVWLIGVEQDSNQDATPMCGGKAGDGLWIGEGVDLGKHALARIAERTLEHRSDLLARRGLSDLRPRDRKRCRMSARQLPVLVEDAHESLDLARPACLESVVVVALAVGAPVQASDPPFPVRDRALHAVDLMTD